MLDFKSQNRNTNTNQSEAHLILVRDAQLIRTPTAPKMYSIRQEILLNKNVQITGQ